MFESILLWCYGPNWYGPKCKMTSDHFPRWKCQNQQILFEMAHDCVGECIVVSLIMLNTLERGVCQFKQDIKALNYYQNNGMCSDLPPLSWNSSNCLKRQQSAKSILIREINKMEWICISPGCLIRRQFSCLRMKTRHGCLCGPSPFRRFFWATKTNITLDAF